jgi:N-acyl-D-amino-acid deacylase
MLERIPIAVNFATLVGHGTVRAVAMGFKSVKPSQRELAVMQELVSEAMEAGALGMSSGLAYAPGCYADTEELIFLCRTVAKYKGIYATHIRDEGKGLIDAVAEAIRIGRDAGISVQISHHKACGRRSWGRVKDTLHLIDTARENGLDVWADQYPYEATSTSLHSILPNWVHEGGKAEFLARLQNPTSRSALRTYLIDEAEKGRIWDYGGWRSIRISSVKHEKNRFCEGLSIEQIARVVSKHPADVILDLLLEEEGDVGMVCFVISEKDVAQVISHPAVLIGSDATARATTGSLSLGKPHPRAYGTFPRVLKKYVRQNQILSLEEAIAKMSGHTAKRLGLKNRGLVREGYYADLVVFDAERICDTATFEEPHRYAEGINYVFVNGMAVVEDGRLISSQKHLPGRVLRRQDN